MRRDQTNSGGHRRWRALVVPLLVTLAGCAVSEERIDEIEQTLILDVGPPAPGPKAEVEPAVVGRVARFEHPDLDYLELMDWYRDFVERIGCNRYELRGIEVPVRGRSERYFVKCHLERSGVGFVVTSETKLTAESGSSVVTADRDLGG